MARLSPHALEPWLAADGLRLDPVQVAHCPWPEAVPAFAQAWSEQLGSLLGTAASAGCCHVVAAAVSASPGAPPR
jgi:hypothetical protein